LEFQLNAYVDQLAEQYPFVSSVSIGKSYENRDMRVIQIAKAGPGKQNVWIEAGKNQFIIYIRSFLKK
jgi:hypothetical protein